ncbi:MAG: trimethylamine methyltransferase family protein [Planctomycetota bacterium]|nr:trimethylamine methyltransferase family protein [Planctomycetota bacterium]
MRRSKRSVTKISHGQTPIYDLLPEGDVHKILDATFELMNEIGVAFDPDPQVLDRFADAGCEITSDNTVKFKRELVEECLDSVSKSTKVWNRDATNYVEIKEGVTSFFPGMTCIKVFDLETGEKRDSTWDDLATITRVADALPNIDGVCTMVKDVPNSTLHGEIGEFVAMAENTTKPLEYLCEDSTAFDAAIEMAAAIRGGMDKLADKPYFTQVITPLPLYFAKTHSDQIIRGAECGIPVTSGTISIGGGSAPITIAGCMTHSLATDFAGITLSQLVSKGSFCHGSAENSFMEPATGSLGNAVPDLLADMAMRQVRGHYGLVPLAGGGGGSSAPCFNQDAAMEISTGLQEAFFLQGGTLDYCGEIDDGITYSLHALLLCDDLAGMLRCLWKGIPVDNEHLALDLTRSVGIRGNYLGEKHTANHCRDNYWKTRYFGARLPLSSNFIPKQDLVERIDKDLREILADHQPEPMPESIREQVRAIHAKFETSQ